MRSRWGLPGMVVIVAFVALTVGACHKKVPPVARPVQPPPPTTFASPTKPPAPPEPISEPVVVPPAPIAEDRVSTASLDEINKNSPLKPVFFDYDTAEISSDGQKILDGNAELLKKYPTWIVTIEGTATSAVRPSTTWRSANAARWRPEPTWCRSGSWPTGSAPSATARSFRSTRATARRRGGRIAATISWSPRSKVGRTTGQSG